jgi:hypothetical protein
MIDQRIKTAGGAVWRYGIESLLLRGDDLDAAKGWMATRKAEASEITDAQRAFIRTSEEAEAARLGMERA